MPPPPGLLSSYVPCQDRVLWRGENEMPSTPVPPPPRVGLFCAKFAGLQTRLLVWVSEVGPVLCTRRWEPRLYMTPPPTHTPQISSPHSSSVKNARDVRTLRVQRW